VYLDVGKRHGGGAPVQQVKWRESVLALLEDSAGGGGAAGAD
jgi:hypothetical protein